MKRTSTEIDPNKFTGSGKVRDSRITAEDLRLLGRIYDSAELKKLIASGFVTKEDVNRLLIEGGMNVSDGGISRSSTLVDEGFVSSRTPTIVDDEGLDLGNHKLIIGNEFASHCVYG